MLDMKDFSYDHQITIRSVGPLKKVFDNLVTDLKASANLRFRGNKMSREAFANAIWLYFGDMELGQIERLLEPYVRRVEEILGEGASPASREVPDLPVGRDRTLDVDPKTGKVLPRREPKGATRSKRKSG